VWSGSDETGRRLSRPCRGNAEDFAGGSALPVRNDEIQALRQDVARMKALVRQMQSNLAFVDTSQSPLKHQFQLEIDMWQTLITEMDRRLDEASRPAH